MIGRKNGDQRMGISSEDMHKRKENAWRGIPVERLKQHRAGRLLAETLKHEMTMMSCAADYEPFRWDEQSCSSYGTFQHGSSADQGTELFRRFSTCVLADELLKSLSISTSQYDSPQRSTSNTHVHLRWINPDERIAQFTVCVFERYWRKGPLQEGRGIIAWALRDDTFRLYCLWQPTHLNDSRSSGLSSS